METVGIKRSGSLEKEKGCYTEKKKREEGPKEKGRELN